MHIAEDMKSYKLDVLAIQETHMGGEAPEEITTADGRDKYIPGAYISENSTHYYLPD